jgi:glycerol-3-phosphate cytidylyltransferase
MKKYKKGYTQGTFDMFHVGHLNVINNAKAQCEYLVVGVNSDVLVQEYKNKTPVISQEDRSKIVSNIKAVDEVVISETLDKMEQLKKVGFDAIFIGDDWKGNARWEETKKSLGEKGVDVVFLPHTDGISSTELRVVKDDKVSDDKNEE